MAIDTGSLYYLVDPFVQFESVNGKPIVGGHVEVFEAGTDNKVITYTDWDGTRHPFKIPLGSDGRAVILVDPGYRYDAYVYDSFNNLVCSRLNIIPLSDGDITIDGMGQVYHDETLSGKGTPNSPLTVISGGKVYGGIYPIDVNNELDMISADNVPLGVQDPLYFVQDDEEGCIIGLSGGIVPEGTMNESAFGYQDGQITSYNGSAFSAGNSYEAGSYVDIDGNTISVTGLQPSGEYVTSGDLDEYTKRTDFDAATGTLNSAKLDVDVYSSQSATFLTAHQSLEGYATEQWVENKGYLTAVPDNYATTGDLQTVSGEITALIPSTAGLATENWVTSQGYLTAHQSLDGLMSASLLEQSGGLITGYNGTAFAGQGGGGVTGDYELSAGSGISIVDYPLEQKTVISVTAQGGNPEVEQAVIDNSATWDSVTAKADSTAIPSLDGYATEDWVTAQGYLTAETDWTNTITAASANAYNEATAAIPTGLATTADLQTVSGEITAMIPSTAGLATEDWVTGQGYITGVDLTPYQTTAGMTAYQSAGDYATTAQLADKVDSSAIGIKTGPVDTVTGISGTYISAWTANNASYASRASLAYADNQGNYFSSTYIKNTDLSTEDGKVTAISGIPLSAGGEVPEGVMVESGLNYDNTEISGYSGSAFKDVALTDVVTANSGAWGGSALPISAGPGIKFEMVNDTLIASTDETIIWSGTGTSGTTINLSESVKNFNTVKFYGHDSTRNKCMIYEQNTDYLTGAETLSFTMQGWDNSLAAIWVGFYYSELNYTDTAYSALTNNGGNQIYLNTETLSWLKNAGRYIILDKIVGINRIAGGN